jgi:hypothetical protein
MSQFNHGVTAELDSGKRSADGCVVHVALSHRLGPFPIRMLIAKMQEHDLATKAFDEFDGIDTVAHQPVEIRAKLNTRNSLQYSGEIMRIVYIILSSTCG